MAMTQHDQSPLICLQGILGNLAPLGAGDPAIAIQIAGARRLIDYMLTERVTAPQLVARSCEAITALLPSVGTVLPHADLGELRALCAAGEHADFWRLLAVAADLERQLIALGTDDARSVAKSIAAIETRYHVELERAVLARSAETNAEKKPTATARNARDVDPQAVQKFLRATFPGESNLVVKQTNVISGGYSKFTIALTLDAVRELPKEIILRADAAATFGGASSVDEYALIRTLYAHGVRVPKPIAADSSGEVIGTRFMIVDKQPGGSIGHMYMLPARNPEVCRDVAEQLARIHRIPPAEFGDRVDNAKGRSSDKAREWLAEGRKAWTPLPMPSPEFEAAFDWLERNAGLNDEVSRGLTHGDVHLANMLVHEGRISTILDWEFAHIGNTAYDLGYFYDQAVALDSWESFLATYAKAGGIVPDQRVLDYVVLFAATRLGVMTCQTIDAFRNGAEPGLAGAIVLGHNFYEQGLRRMGRMLERVL